VWFFYHLSREEVYSHFELKMTGTGSKRLNERTFLSLPIDAPKYPEQQKIADCLASADALIAAQGRKVEALRAHKKGLMQQLFPQEGETQPRLRFPEFEGAGDWEEHKLGDVCELYQPVTLSSSELTMTGEHLVYGANGVIGTHNEYNHADSEVAVTCRGATCGEVTRTLPMSWITGNAMVVRPRSARLAKDFLFQYFKNHGLKSTISGSAQPQITRAGFSPLPVSFPAPSEQQRIADCLTSLDDLITAEARKLDTLKIHKRGLMQQLFPQVGEGDA
jgi:type I restriction enzyme S subunit